MDNRGRKRFPEAMAQKVRWLYHNTSCSAAVIARHYNISSTTVSNMISRKGAYSEKTIRNIEGKVIPALCDRREYPQAIQDQGRDGQVHDKTNQRSHRALLEGGAMETEKNLSYKEAQQELKKLKADYKAARISYQEYIVKKRICKKAFQK